MKNSDLEKQLLNKGYKMEKAQGGHYRLFDLAGNLVHDDSAFEDVYDYESALYFFNEYVKEISYRFQEISLNDKGEEFDTQFTREFDNYAEASDFYDAYACGMETEKELIRLSDNKTIEQSY
jgi:hypothetical protein